MKREERAYKVCQIAPKDALEIAVIGRSNCGKSSFINCILGSKVAKVAQKPGATLWLGIHRFCDKVIIDLPGYGYAKTHLERRIEVSDLVQGYFQLNRTDLVIMLVDMRRGIMDVDRYVMRDIAAPIIIIGTKADKKEAVNCENYTFCCSSLKKNGIEEIRKYIAGLSTDQDGHLITLRTMKSNSSVN